MAFDFKKEYREFYLPKDTPGLVAVPAVNFAAVRGRGDPNLPDGEYRQAIGILYALAFTIKMSYRGPHKIQGYFDYVVPPLEGFWWMEGHGPIDYARKDLFRWISAIRLPDFVSREDFAWGVEEAARKKGADFSGAEFWTCTEGACVQCMHIGPYDDEPATVSRMESFAAENGLAIDLSERRLHHEIYLSDARRCAPEKRRTVIRIPVAPVKRRPSEEQT